VINKQVTDKYYLKIVAGIIGQELGLHYPNNRLQELLRGLERTSELFQGKYSTISIIEEIIKAKSIPQYLYSQLSTALTINETYFFRETPAIDLFKTVIISEIKKSGGNYKIWSAGCSSGEEPFTLAIIIKEMLPAHIAKNIKIIATDISSKALNKAKEGVYTEWSFRETPQNIKNKYFKAVDSRWLISEEIKEMVSFSHLNLISENFPSPSMGIDNLNLIFCRNVLMYFSIDSIKVVINKFHNSLCEGGWLITSQVELNNELFSNFGKINVFNGFFYIKEERAYMIKESPRNYIKSRTSKKIIDKKPATTPKKPTLNAAKALANRGDYEKALDILEELSNNDGEYHIRLEPESNYSGTGVGLSTVKRIIEKHNGEIWAESAPSDGTTFFFTLQ